MSTEINGLEFPVEFPVSFNQSSNGINFPIRFPVTFNGSVVGMKFPFKFPFTFEGEFGLRFPMKFPVKFKSSRQVRNVTIKIPINFTADTQVYHGVVKVPYNVTPIGKVVSVPFREKAWWFPGLFIQENIISEMHSSLNVTENVQSLILADFELESTNRVKVSWYGNTVPSLSVMKKADSDETYINDGTYAWGSGSAMVDISGEDYNIYLQGTSNSGTSAIYTIGGANDLLVIPEVEVTLNEKIYDLSIDNQCTYRLVIDY